MDKPGWVAQHQIDSLRKQLAVVTQEANEYRLKEKELAVACAEAIQKAHRLEMLLREMPTQMNVTHEVALWYDRVQAALREYTFHPKQRGVVTEWKASETIEGEPPPKPKGQLGQ